jgi:hypothetical protein
MQGRDAAMASAPPAMFDNSSPEDWSRADQPPPPDQPVVCEVMLPDGLELSSDCPQVHPTRGDACTLAPNLACVYGTVPSPGQAAGVSVETCEDMGQGPQWIYRDGATCKRETCFPADAPLVSVDASSCTQRTPLPCSDGLTAQAQLDYTLAALLRQLKLWPDLGGTVGIAFENGCPTGFFNDFGLRTAEEQTKFVNALAGIRWACAEDLSCTLLHGANK